MKENHLFSNSCAFPFIVSHINLPNSIALTANVKKTGSTNLLKPPVARKLLQNEQKKVSGAFALSACFTKGGKNHTEKCQS